MHEVVNVSKKIFSQSKRGLGSYFCKSKNLLLVCNDLRTRFSTCDGPKYLFYYDILFISRASAHK
jgi:hypothetical protein